MTAALLAPLGLVFATAAAVPAVARRIQPAHGARLLGLVLTVLIAATWASASSLALAHLAHQRWIGDARWCDHALGVHELPPAMAGGLALLISAALTWQALTVALARCRIRGSGARRIIIVDADQAVAYAEPGRAGGVVITTAMLDALGPVEQRALLAHEQAHLRHRHDRYLVVAAMVDAVPLLRALSRQLRASLERWADEDAARSVGDRRTVASAIARAALHAPAGPPAALAATGGEVPERVLALIDPAPARRWAAVAGLAVVALTVTASLTQLHHLGAVVATLCHH